MTKDKHVSTNYLLPCPFCAAEATEYSGDSHDVLGYFGVRCDDCGVYIETDIDGLHLKKWNTRAVCCFCGNAPIHDDIDISLYGKGESKTLQELKDDSTTR